MKKITIVSLLIAIVFAFNAFAPTSEAAIPFKDVNTTDKELYEAVSEFYAQGIVFGKTSTAYKPGDQATRGETAQFIVNALGWQNENKASVGYTDIANSPYKDAINILANKKVITYDASTKKFNPNNPLRRAHIAKMLVLAFELEEVSDLKNVKFTDIKGYDLATQQYIATLVKYEVTTGKTETRFGPSDFVTRGQLAKFLYRGYNIEQDSEGPEVIDIY